ncbi:type VI secretion system baseplate subunit TssF [Shewanella glacialimarina]|uniref:type VI secretion system baseplate subunit TssF n=1 Tax=Shewanella glacialimarina TaxID=2590884 RepID=UPI001CF8AAF5|nr:type VI secretion system baseplate subunit TssF [Shewanella glacialimarina]UCX04442.1 type VI secretion system baseplate subunit TssF [Shewanella glacialimarina]
MNQELLEYYNRELAFIRHMGSEFAEQYPKVAGRLRLSDEHVEDPHVSRLIEAFSLLTAQIRQKLDDSFPELTEALLGQLYPDYQAPIPSMSVIQLTTENLSTTGVQLPKGTQVETQVEGMKSCQFKTCYDMKLWPIKVKKAQFQNAPFNAPEPQWPERAQAIIKLDITCEFEEINMPSLGVDKLRFFLNGQDHQTFQLYQLLFEHSLGFALVNESQSVCKFLTKRHLQSVGFDDAEQVIPYSQRSSAGYRLLLENFIFPEKFLFFDIDDLSDSWQGLDSKFSLYIYLQEGSSDLEKQVTASHFLLGCTPIINLFEQKLESVSIDGAQYEYKLAARYADAEVTEIINVQEVTAFDPKDNKVAVTPFYGESHPQYLGHSNLFWHVRRESASWAGGYSEQGTESYLSLVDHHFKGFTAEEGYGSWVLSINALCSNRNLPAHLPFSTDEPKMFVPERADIIKQVKCLLAPTLPVRAALSDASRWQLVSHLSIDSFSGPNALNNLKQTLKLYDFKCSPENKKLIENIYQVNVTTDTARVNQSGRISFCSGSHIEITFINDHYSGSGVFFFCCILDHFFAQFSVVNSFTRLSMRFKDQDAIYHTWPARAGKIPLL